MATSPHQATRIDHSPSRAPALPMDEVDCEKRLDPDPQPDASQSTRAHLRLWRIFGFLGLVLFVHRFWPMILVYTQGQQSEAVVALGDLCPQVGPLFPVEHAALLETLDRAFDTCDFQLNAYESLGGAIRFPTESLDDLGLPSEDPRWEVYNGLHEYLESRFPRVHANLNRTKVNTYAPVYEWKGTEDVKPLMLTGHMDVISVNRDTYDDWVYPPFSGQFDGEWIWGRGGCDDKSGVIGILTAVETLLEHGFVPSRTVVMAFGVDEERGGRAGARAIAEHLLETYGPDSMAMIVDEGFASTVVNDTVFAIPVVVEKGYMDIRMDVFTPGGNAILAPGHTGIGILAELITELEAHPHEPKLVRGGGYYQSLECRAKYDPNFPTELRRLLQQSQTSDKKLRELEGRLAEFDPMFHAMAGTTQAIDLVGGGTQAGALPEAAWAVVNHRVADHTSLTEVMDRFTNITLKVAAKHNMSLEAFGKPVRLQGLEGPGTIRLSDDHLKTRAPSPLSPSAGSRPYELLSGTIQSTIQTHHRTGDLPKSSVISPALLYGSSDSGHYRKLSRHIFRYQHLDSTDIRNERMVNEGVLAEGFLEMIRFFTRLILNADQSDVLE